MKSKMYVTLNEWGESKIRTDALSAFYLGNLIFILMRNRAVGQQDKHGAWRQLNMSDNTGEKLWGMRN